MKVRTRVGIGVEKGKEKRKGKKKETLLEETGTLGVPDGRY